MCACFSAVFFYHLQGLEAMLKCSLPNDVDLIDVDRSDLVVLPSLEKMYNSSCMACMYHPSSHCVLQKKKQIIFSVKIVVKGEKNVVSSRLEVRTSHDPRPSTSSGSLMAASFP